MLKTAKICLVCIVVSKCNERIYEIDRPDRKKANFTIVCYDVRKKCIFISRSALIGQYSQAECFQKWSHPLWESFCSQNLPISTRTEFLSGKFKKWAQILM